MAKRCEPHFQIEGESQLNYRVFGRSSNFTHYGLQQLPIMLGMTALAQDSLRLRTPRRAFEGKIEHTRAADITDGGPQQWKSQTPRKAPDRDRSAPGSGLQRISPAPTFCWRGPVNLSLLRTIPVDGQSQPWWVQFNC